MGNQIGFFFLFFFFLSTEVFGRGCLFWGCFFCLFFIFWPGHEARGILVPRLGIKPVPPAVEAWSLNQWTVREVPSFFFLEERNVKKRYT